MIDKEFICCKCKKNIETSFTFGGYGNEKAVVEKMNNKHYCEEHFNAKYKLIFGEIPMSFESKGEEALDESF